MAEPKASYLEVDSLETFIHTASVLTNSMDAYVQTLIQQVKLLKR